MTEITICENTECGKPIDFESGEFFSTDWHGGKTFCNDCFQSDLEVPSRVWRIGEKVERVDFGDLVALDEYGEVPEWFFNLWASEDATRLWVSSSAWRGYFDTIKNFKPEFTSIGAGWTTAYPDGTTQRKADFNEIVENMVKQEIFPPVPTYLLFEPTSNVFSMACEMFCESEDDAAELKKWLDQDIEQLLS